MKSGTTEDQWQYTYYARDATGEIMAVYEKTYIDPEYISDPIIPFHTLTRGEKRYELSNHLGNVLVTVSDRKLQLTTDEETVSGYTADVWGMSDYYAFGMLMPGRNQRREGYRFGFNGKEQDDEVSGQGNQYDYGFRVYNPRIGKFLSVDPLSPEYPWYTPYQFAGNKPIWAVDLDGLEEMIYHRRFTDTYGGKTILKIWEATTAYKTFQKTLLSQTAFDVYLVPLKFDRNVIDDGSEIDWDVFNTQFEGFSLEGAYGQTTVSPNLLDFRGMIYKNKLDQYQVSSKRFQDYLANYEYSFMEESDIESTFLAGKQLIIIGLNVDFLDQLDKADFMYRNQNKIPPTEQSPSEFLKVWSPENVQNLALEGSYTVGHEAMVHAIQVLIGQDLPMKEEHKRFYNIESITSPSVKDIQTDMFLRQTPGYKLYQDINRSTLKNFTQPGTRHE